MAVLSQLRDAGAPDHRHSPLIVSARAPAARRRIGEALTAQGLRPARSVETPEELFEVALGESAIVIFLCDVDAAREVTMLRRLRRRLPAPSIVAISPPTTGTGVRRALEAGADALVFEPELEATLVVAVRAVTSGQSVVPRKLRAGVERPALSHRERQVLGFVARGLTNAQIGECLYLSESTIKSHLSSAFSKLGVRSRREAAAQFRDLERTA